MIQILQKLLEKFTIQWNTIESISVLKDSNYSLINFNYSIWIFKNYISNINSKGNIN